MYDDRSFEADHHLLDLQGFRVVRMEWSKQLRGAHTPSQLEHVDPAEIASDGSAISLPDTEWEPVQQVQRCLSKDAACSSASMKIYCAAAGSQHLEGLLSFQSGHTSLVQRIPAPDAVSEASLLGQGSPTAASNSSSTPESNALNNTGAHVERDDRCAEQAAPLHPKKNRSFTRAGVQALLVFTEYVVRSKATGKRHTLLLALRN